MFVLFYYYYLFFDFKLCLK